MLSHGGYNKSDIDNYLYNKQAKDGGLLILILYVEDMLIFNMPVGTNFSSQVKDDKYL